ncbi:P-loop containing nucleoside triphosphate hydrolase protein [Gaertneriomyces semiglobifer]|nr:P-loop containing nucleoside triphosphate hydrolase protein [Gaertneriomyces semiglobifer]
MDQWNYQQQQQQQQQQSYANDPADYSYFDQQPVSYPFEQGPENATNSWPSHSDSESIWSNSFPETGSSQVGSVCPSTPAGHQSSAGSQRDNPDENIRVVVRIRPLNHHDNYQDPVVLSCHADGRTIQVNAPSAEPRTLTFHRVLDGAYGQAAFFEESGVKELIMKSLDGYATTVFAFGQTGSGKTYTCTGPQGAEVNEMHGGLILRAMAFVFHQIASRPHLHYRMRLTFLEIYNERVHDLLAAEKTQSLTVRWNRRRGFYVENQLVIDCHSMEDCVAVIQEGLRNRATRAHALNEYSSRSHSIFTVYLDSKDVEGPQSQDRYIKYGKISFVDLAGSERVNESKATGKALDETSNINKSLLTLGNCISALSDRRTRGGHIPFRDSKLTQLLADSLGGSGIAMMIACIAPSLRSLGETYKTLRYAARARKIRNRPIVQVDENVRVIAELRHEIQRLRRENDGLRRIRSVHASSAGYVTLPALPTGKFNVVAAPVDPSIRQTSSPGRIPQSATSRMLLTERAKLAEDVEKLEVEVARMKITTKGENSSITDSLFRHSADFR